MKKLLYLLIVIFLSSCGSNMSPHEEISEKYICDTAYESIIETPTFSVDSKTTKILYEYAKYGDINYIMTDTMIINQSTIINVTISENVSKDTIIKEVKSFTEDNTVVYVIRIAPVMRVKLIDPSGGENFTIVSVTPEEQIVENDEFTKWEWDVTALKIGNNKLKLTVDIVVDDKTKNIEVYEDFIYVYSDKTWWNSFIDFMRENWKWVLSTLIIPFLIYMYKIRKNKKIHENIKKI